MTGSLSQALERELASLAQAWLAVDVLVLFGSAARGRLAGDSDVDLYVRFARAASADRADRADGEAGAHHGVHDPGDAREVTLATWRR